MLENESIAALSINQSAQIVEFFIKSSLLISIENAFDRVSTVSSF